VKAPPVLIVSDLHLDQDPGPTLSKFLQFLDGPVQGAAALYILGDLFEYWVGDDAGFPAAEQLADALSALRMPVTFQHGNRDFLLGTAYAERAGLQLAPEVLPVEFAPGDALLIHGDSLCTADIEHMRFRALVRDAEWQQGFLARPLAERIAEAERVRAISREAGQMKASEIMDVHPEAVAELLRGHGRSLLIHGHTHRPAIHHFQVDGRPCMRCVLPSWDELPGYLELDADGPRLLTLDGRNYPVDSGLPASSA
jgi:UDP-2,3-diacylglucosamine hydrolase